MQTCCLSDGRCQSKTLLGAMAPIDVVSQHLAIRDVVSDVSKQGNHIQKDTYIYRVLKKLVFDPNCDHIDETKALACEDIFYSPLPISKCLNPSIHVSTTTVKADLPFLGQTKATHLVGQNLDPSSTPPDEMNGSVCDTQKLIGSQAYGSSYVKPVLREVTLAHLMPPKFLVQLYPILVGVQILGRHGMLYFGQYSCGHW